jgi:hypothetical protein
MIMQEAQTLLVPWESFYVIVGSSGAALTGLQFVVIALTTESARPSTNRELATFATPTVIHFCAVLLLAAILSAPKRNPVSTSLALGFSPPFESTYTLFLPRGKTTTMIPTTATAVIHTAVCC